MFKILLVVETSRWQLKLINVWIAKAWHL